MPVGEGAAGLPEVGVLARRRVELGPAARRRGALLVGRVVLRELARPPRRRLLAAVVVAARTQALAVALGLEGETPRSVSKQLKAIRNSLDQVTFEPEPYFAKSEDGETTYTATELYLNEKVQDLYNRAEVERQDYRRVNNPPNVFFGQQRRFRYAPHPEEMAPDDKSRVITVETLHLNLIAMFTFVVGAFFLLHTTLKRQLRKV